MTFKRSAVALLAGACGVALTASTFTGVHAQQQAGVNAQAAVGPEGCRERVAVARGGGAGRGRGGRGGVAPGLFSAADINKDGALTREELKTTFATWYDGWDSGKTNALDETELAAGLTAALPAPAFGGGGRSAAQNEVPYCDNLANMMAALPDKAPATPMRPRKVLVLAKAEGFVHSSIPLAARTVEALGNKTGAWATTISYDPADINTANLQQYDAIFLDSTTGEFLDDPADPAATTARRAALLAFVRGGKGLAGIHAAGDSYHTMGPPAPPRPAAAPRGEGTVLAPVVLRQGDTNHDQKISRDEMAALADTWFDKVDPEKTGKVDEADFATRFGSDINPPAARGGGRGARGAGGPPAPVVGRAGAFPGSGTWPAFNQMIGGYFKFHWFDPQLITVKIDDPTSPLTAMFHGQEFEIHDETYTFAQDSWSRKNVHVLTSIDYSKMSDVDKAKEDWPRTDHDYGLSWIRREGSGRVFYEAHGHDEKIYAITPMLEHVLAGIQYAIGDLKADDSPSEK